MGPALSFDENIAPVRHMMKTGPDMTLIWMSFKMTVCR